MSNPMVGKCLGFLRKSRERQTTRERVLYVCLDSRQKKPGRAGRPGFEVLA